MLLKNENYKEMGESYFDNQNKPKVVSRLVHRLTKLGYYVTLQAGTQSLSPATDACNAETTAEPSSISPITPRHQPRRGRGRPCKCSSRGIECKHNRNLTSK